MSRLTDADLVRKEYESEAALSVRAGAYRWADGPDSIAMCVAAVAEVSPARVLDVGCGRGNIAERVAAETAADVVGVDQSERMVELTRARGIEAVVGDVRRLPFEDGSFDCALAAWMLFHVDDVDAALAEIARVLTPGGRLVAATNSQSNMRELRRLVGAPEPEFTFSLENGSEQLRRRFRRVERRDAVGSLRFPDRAAIQEYVDAAITFSGRIPDDVPEPFVVARSSCVFVADL
ncbi:MAG TPA: class I SAM-dependent methyltransferase [Gaiellaceae bacterium]|nr:class I SAM-dependent methyltransferase [Gaiellaceae bacterium]